MFKMFLSITSGESACRRLVAPLVLSLILITKDAISMTRKSIDHQLSMNLFLVIIDRFNQMEKAVIIFFEHSGIYFSGYGA